MVCNVCVLLLLRDVTMASADVSAAELLHTIHRLIPFRYSVDGMSMCEEVNVVLLVNIES